MISNSAPILLLEDSLEDFESIVRGFKKQNILNPLKHVMRAEDGLDYIRTGGAPCLFLLDVNMAGMCGREFLKTVKRDAKTKDIPVVILTCSDDSPDLNACQAYGANAYILKSSNLDLLAGSVARLKEYLLDIPMHPEIPGDEAGLTSFEIKTLTWIAKGKSRQETGAILGVSEEIVKVRLEICCAKLAALNVKHAVSLAIRQGLLFVGL